MKSSDNIIDFVKDKLVSDVSVFFKEYPLEDLVSYMADAISKEIISNNNINNKDNMDGLKHIDSNIFIASKIIQLLCKLNVSVQYLESK